MKRVAFGELFRKSQGPLDHTTLLTRVFRGREYHVRVLPNGFEYDGEAYRSLSAVAHAITGSHWNGYHFFHKSFPENVEQQ